MINKKIRLFVIVNLLFFSFLAIAQETKTHNIQTCCQSELSILTKKDWANILSHVSSFLEKNLDRLSVENNESGFVRVRVPSPDIKLQNDKSIKYIRINYFPSDNLHKMKPGSVHDHKNYFESLIILGSYTHSIHEKCNVKKENKICKEKNVYAINKKNSQLEHLNSDFIKLVYKETVKKGDILIFPTDILHKIESGVINTLSINVIFEDSTKKQFSNIYADKDLSLEQIKINREKLSREQKSYILQEILSILIKFDL